MLESKSISKALFLALCVGILFGSSAVCFADYSGALELYYQGRYSEARLALDGVNHPNRQLLMSLIQLRLNDAQYKETFKSATIPSIGTFENVLKFWFSDTSNVLAMSQSVKRIENSNRPVFVESANLALAKSYFDAGKYSDSYALAKRIGNVAKGENRRDALLVELRSAIKLKRRGTAEELYRGFICEYPTSDKGFAVLIDLNREFGTTYGVLDVLQTRARQMEYMRGLFSRRASFDFHVMLDALANRGLSDAERRELAMDRGILEFEAGQEKECIETMRGVGARSAGGQNSATVDYYIARSLHKLKKYSEAKDAYQRFLAEFPSSDLAPPAYYYLYWVCQELRLPNDFQPYLKEFKAKHSGSIYYDKLMWEFGWNAYLKQDYSTAFDIFNRTDWKFDPDVVAKVTFWLAKAAEHIDVSSAPSLFRRVVDTYPFSYYGYRVVTQMFPDQAGILSGRFRSTDLQIDPLYTTMLDAGLGDMAVVDLDYRINRLKDRNARTVVTMAYLYSGMLQNHRAINLLTSLGFGINPKEPHFSKEIAQLLYPRPYWGIIQKYSLEFQVDPYFVLALMREESLFNAGARSRTGALGLMQIMPSTGAGIAKGLGMDWDGADTLLVPEKNIRLGTSYVASLKKRFNNNPVLILSGYNAGPNVTRRWLDRSDSAEDMDMFVANIPYQETHYYVTRVLKSYWIYRLLYDPKFQPNQAVR